VRGKITLISVNSPGRVSTSIEPPCCLTMMSWLMERPRPVPSPDGLVVKNGLNIFSFTCGRVAADGNEHTDGSADKLRRQRCHLVVLTHRPTVFDCYVLVLDVAVFGEPTMECSQLMRTLIGRPRAEESDGRYRRLLRASECRPRYRCATEKCDELAPPHRLHPRLESHRIASIEVR
jgi:hypothetical protein